MCTESTKQSQRLQIANTHRKLNTSKQCVISQTVRGSLNNLNQYQILHIFRFLQSKIKMLLQVH